MRIMKYEKLTVLGFEKAEKERHSGILWSVAEQNVQNLPLFSIKVKLKNNYKKHCLLWL